jgi:thiol-disulfide isomerase/thioredoxin
MAVELVSDSEFKEKLGENEKVVVKYYADWCGSCRLFKPKYKRLSNDERFEGVTFLDVNAEKNPDARKTGGVTNLPYFAIFQNGELVEGVASSKEEAVVELIQKLQ